MTRVLCIYKAVREPPLSPDTSAVTALIEEMTLAGVLLAAERCMDSAKSARLRILGGDVQTREGPFTDERASVTGVILLQVGSRAEAIEWNKRILRAFGDGECELYELYPVPAQE